MKGSREPFQNNFLPLASRGTDKVFTYLMAKQSAPIPSDDDKLLRELKSRFMRAKRGESKWREQKEIWEKFYDGDQWTDEEKRILKERNQPAVVINRVKPKIDSIIGMELKMPVDTKAFELRSYNFNKARHMSEAFRFIEQTTNFDGEENKAFKSQIIKGRGWYKIHVRWTGFDPEILTEERSVDDIFLDPYCKRTDLMDAKDIHESIWQDIDDTKTLFPQHGEEIEKALLPESDRVGWVKDKYSEIKPDQYREPGDVVSDTDYPEFVQKERRRIRIVSSWYREPYQKKFLFEPKSELLEDITEGALSDIKKIKKAFPGAQEFVEIRYKLNVCTYCWNRILEKKLDIKPDDRYGTFDFVLVPGIPYEGKELRGHYMGLVAQMVDLQREINMRRSKMLHLLNTNRARFEKGAFDNPELARQEWTKPDGWLEQNPNYQFAADTNIPIAESQFMLLQEAKTEIDNTGVRGEVEGVSKAKSGRDFLLRHEASTQMLSPMLYNLRGARRRVAQIWKYYVQKLWRSPRTFSLSDDPNEVIELNKTVTDPITGESIVINDVAAGDYDVVIEEAPESMNLQAEDWEKLVKLAQTGVPLPPQLLIETSPLSPKQKEQVMGHVTQMQQAAAAQPGAGMPAAGAQKQF